MMLRLKNDTNPGWIDAAMNDLDAVLLDHVHAEKKAAATALSLVNRHPEKDRLVDSMISHMEEELDHFRRVLAICRNRGLKLGHDKADEYVNLLLKHVRRQEPHRLLDTLICAALIEARSCERFSILMGALPDGPERSLFEDLLPSEARHYALFMELAREYFPEEEVEQRFQEISDEEGKIVAGLPNEARVHG